MRPIHTMPLRIGNSVLDRRVPSPLAYRNPGLRRASGLGQTAQEMRAAKTKVGAAGVVALALLAGGAWVGVRTGLREKGFLSVTGWAVGVGSVLTALTTVGVLAALPFVPNDITTPAIQAPGAAPYM